MSAYPIVLTALHNARCVVVGGGAVAERKVGALLEGGAQVTLISPTLTKHLEAWFAAGRFHYIARRFAAGDLVGAALVFAATDERRVNAAVAQEAQQAGVLVNVADDPDAGNFHTAATVRRGDLLVAITTGGAAPTVAADVRRRLEIVIGDEYGALLELLAELRDGPARTLDATQRARLWRELSAEHVLDQLRAGRVQDVRTHAYSLIEQ